MTEHADIEHAIAQLRAEVERLRARVQAMESAIRAETYWLTSRRQDRGRKSA